MRTLNNCWLPIRARTAKSELKELAMKAKLLNSFFNHKNRSVSRRTSKKPIEYLVEITRHSSQIQSRTIQSTVKHFVYNGSA